MLNLDRGTEVFSAHLKNSQNKKLGEQKQNKLEVCSPYGSCEFPNTGKVTGGEGGNRHLLPFTPFVHLVMRQCKGPAGAVKHVSLPSNPAGRLFILEVQEPAVSKSLRSVLTGFSLQSSLSISGAIQPSVPGTPERRLKLCLPTASFLQRPKSEIMALILPCALGMERRMLWGFRSL